MAHNFHRITEVMNYDVHMAQSLSNHLLSEHFTKKQFHHYNVDELVSS